MQDDIAEGQVNRYLWSWLFPLLMTRCDLISDEEPDGLRRPVRVERRNEDGAAGQRPSGQFTVPS